jgi:hypothetical protein
MAVTAPLCSPGDTTMFHIGMSHATCVETAAPGGYMSPGAACCYTDGCNAPLAAADNSTTTGTGPVGNSTGQATAAQSSTCWESIPAVRAPNSTWQQAPPYLAAVSPVSHPATDSYGRQSTCVRYQKQCAANNDFCSSEERAAGTGNGSSSRARKRTARTCNLLWMTTAI